MQGQCPQQFNGVYGETLIGLAVQMLATFVRAEEERAHALLLTFRLSSSFPTRSSVVHAPTLFASSPSFSSHLAATLVDITRHTRTTHTHKSCRVSLARFVTTLDVCIHKSSPATLVRASIEVTMAAAR